MNAIIVISSADVPEIGTLFQGGFYTGRILAGDQVYGIITAPKALGELSPMAWGEYGKDIPGANSFFDGYANTAAMAESGSPLAQEALKLSIDGFANWYIPSRDEMELQYRAFKPTTEGNWVFRNGDNPSSIPAGYPYTKSFPAQTSLNIFRAGGPEAFEAEWYWSSTQYSPDGAWRQYFVAGHQDLCNKTSRLRARAVRRFIIQ